MKPVGSDDSLLLWRVVVVWSWERQFTGMKSLVVPRGQHVHTGCPSPEF